ncbi:MAG: nuclear transport factor 2 family protein [Blastocatellia bacterium]|nr:nuclear transport factor 2 family protein [Blastocatellia bacterium]
MKHLLRLALLLLCLPLPLAARVDPPMNDEQAIARFEDEFSQAWARRDLGFVERYFSRDPELMWFFERRQLKGFEDVRKLYERMFRAGGNVKRTLSNRVIRVYGDGAFSSANFRIESVDRGRRVVDEGRISTFYARQNGQWAAVHRHSSFQAPAGPQRRVPLANGLNGGAKF